MPSSFDTCPVCERTLGSCVCSVGKKSETKFWDKDFVKDFIREQTSMQKARNLVLFDEALIEERIATNEQVLRFVREGFHWKAKLGDAEMEGYQLDGNILFTKIEVKESP